MCVRMYNYYNNDLIILVHPNNNYIHTSATASTTQCMYACVGICAIYIRHIIII